MRVSGWWCSARRGLWDGTGAGRRGTDYRPGDRCHRRGRARRDCHRDQHRNRRRPSGDSNSAGGYTLPALPPGVYTIDVMLSGFRPARHEDVRVETGVTIRLDFSLVIGNLSETVTVAAETPALRATASLGQVVSEEKVVALPLNGRSFITLSSLVPGVALPQGSQFPAHQRRPAADQRVSVRRHLRVAAGARPGRVLSDRRRDPGIQDRDEQPAGGIRPLQRRRHQPDDESRDQCAAWQRRSSSSGTSR